MKLLTLEIPVIPGDLTEKLDRFRGGKSREEYVLIVLQRALLGDRPAIFPEACGE